MSFQRNIKKVEVPIFNFEVPTSQNNTFPIQFRVITEGGAKVSAWSNVYEVPGLTVLSENVLGMVNKTGANKKVTVSWDDENNANLYDIFVHRFQNMNFIDGASGATGGSFTLSKTATVATVTVFDGKGGTGTKREHGLKVGMNISVSGTDVNFDRVSTVVTEVVDPYTFKYSPVGSVTVVNPGSYSQNAANVSVLAAQTTTLSLSDYVYVDTTNRTSYNVSKSFTILNSLGIAQSASSTHMFATVQVASSNRKPNGLLTVGFANIATP